MNILFVCTGNTCRSAMAQGIAKKIIKENPERYRFIKVASAGTYSNAGEGASANAKTVSQAHDIDLSNFVAQQVTPQLLAEADLVLAMTGSHKKLLNALAPEAIGKIYLLKEYELGENVNELNVKLSKLFEEYGLVRENFVKGNQKQLEKLDQLAQKDPAQAEQLFKSLNGELEAGLAALDEQINAIHDRLKEMEIIDPFGGDVGEYQACYDQLESSIRHIFDTLADQSSEEAKQS